MPRKTYDSRKSVRLALQRQDPFGWSYGGLDDRQAQSRSTRRGLLAALKPPSHAIQIGRVDPFASVDHEKLEPVSQSAFDLDLARAAVMNRILD